MHVFSNINLTPSAIFEGDRSESFSVTSIVVMSLYADVAIWWKSGESLVFAENRVLEEIANNKGQSTYIGEFYKTAISDFHNCFSCSK